MAWTQRTVTDYKDCLSLVRQFTQKAFKAGSVTAGGGNTGDGTVYGASASHQSVAETWTLTATSATNFTVSGSVSGAQTDATVGVPYSIDEVSFIINAGAAAFAATDSFTFAVSASAADWIEDDFFTDFGGGGNYWLVQHGIGAGSDEIYASFRTFTNNSFYWNMAVSGQTGYLPGYVDGSTDTTFGPGAQPGYFPYYDCMNNTSFTVMVVCTSRHIKIIPTVGSIQGGSYVGWILPHATVSQFNYPMFGGGSTDTAAQLPGDSEDRHTCYWNAHSDEYSGAVLDSTSWVEINRWSPNSYGRMEIFRPGLVDNKMRLYAATPIDEASDNVYGQLEGVYYPTGYVPGGGILTAGDIITTSEVTALVYQDVDRSGPGNLVAMDLMGD